MDHRKLPSKYLGNLPRNTKIAIQSKEVIYRCIMLYYYYTLAITIDAFLGGHCEDSTISHTYFQPRNSSGNCPAPHNVCAACRGPTKMRKKKQIRNLKNLGNCQGGKYIDGKNRQTESGAESRRINLLCFLSNMGCFSSTLRKMNPLTLM